MLYRYTVEKITDNKERRDHIFNTRKYAGSPMVYISINHSWGVPATSAIQSSVQFRM